MKQIELTQGKYAIVEDADYALLNQFKWQAKRDRNTWYAVRTVRQSGSKRTVIMHRLILQAVGSQQVDHCDGNGLNNLHSNLRFSTNAQNQYNSRIPSNNTSGFMGVSYSCGKWQAEIMCDNRRIYIGRFESAELAAKAYDEKATSIFGEFARLNLPKGAHQP
jgi:uncharacterized protein affecting Mg2+/Co2+ transport